MPNQQKEVQPGPYLTFRERQNFLDELNPLVKEVVLQTWLGPKTDRKYKTLLSEEKILDIMGERVGLGIKDGKIIPVIAGLNQSMVLISRLERGIRGNKPDPEEKKAIEKISQLKAVHLEINYEATVAEKVLALEAMAGKLPDRFKDFKLDPKTRKKLLGDVRRAGLIPVNEWLANLEAMELEPVPRGSREYKDTPIDRILDKVSGKLLRFIPSHRRMVGLAAPTGFSNESSGGSSRRVSSSEKIGGVVSYQLEQTTKTALKVSVILTAGGILMTACGGHTINATDGTPVDIAPSEMFFPTEIPLSTPDIPATATKESLVLPTQPSETIPAVEVKSYPTDASGLLEKKLSNEEAKKQIEAVSPKQLAWMKYLLEFKILGEDVNQMTAEQAEKELRKRGLEFKYVVNSVSGGWGVAAAGLDGRNIYVAVDANTNTPYLGLTPFSAENQSKFELKRKTLLGVSGEWREDKSGHNLFVGLDENGKVSSYYDAQADAIVEVKAVPVLPTVTLKPTEDVKYNELVEALKGQREMIQQNYKKFMAMDQATFISRRRELGFGSFYDKERMLGFIREGYMPEIDEKDYTLQGVLLGIQIVKVINYNEEVYVAYFGVEDQGGGRGMLPVFLGDVRFLSLIYEADFNEGHRNFLGVDAKANLEPMPIGEGVELLLKRIGDVVYFDIVTNDCNDVCWENEKNKDPNYAELELEHKLYIDLLIGGVRGKVLLGEIAEMLKKPGGAEGLKRFKILEEETSFEELVKIPYYMIYSVDERIMNFFSNK